MLQGHFSSHCLSSPAAEGHPLNITIYLLISLSPYVSEHRGNSFRTTEAHLWKQSKANSSFSSLHTTKWWLRARLRGCISSGNWEGCITYGYSQRVSDKCCSVKANLPCKTCQGLSILILIFFFFFFFVLHFSFGSLRQLIFVHPTAENQKQGDCNWVWRFHGTQAFTCIYTSLKSDSVLPVAYWFVVMCYSVTYFDAVILPICFPYATPGRAIYKSFYQHKLYTLLESTNS